MTNAVIPASNEDQLLMIESAIGACNSKSMSHRKSCAQSHTSLLTQAHVPILEWPDRFVFWGISNVLNVRDLFASEVGFFKPFSCPSAQFLSFLQKHPPSTISIQSPKAIGTGVLMLTTMVLVRQCFLFGWRRVQPSNCFEMKTVLSTEQNGHC